MKIIKLFLLLAVTSICSNVVFAQVSVGVNIGVPLPNRYYYLQDIGVYFDIGASLYVYPSGSRWIRARSLPPSGMCKTKRKV